MPCTRVLRHPGLQDLRVHDNPALVEAARVAAALGGQVTFLYIHSPQEEGEARGGAHERTPTAPACLPV